MSYFVTYLALALLQLLRHLHLLLRHVLVLVSVGELRHEVLDRRVFQLNLRVVCAGGRWLRGRVRLVGEPVDGHTDPLELRLVDHILVHVHYIELLRDLVRRPPQHLFLFQVLGEHPDPEVGRDPRDPFLLLAQTVVAELLEVLEYCCLHDCLAFITPEVLYLNYVYHFLVVAGLNDQVRLDSLRELLNCFLAVYLEPPVLLVSMVLET